MNNKKKRTVLWYMECLISELFLSCQDILCVVVIKNKSLNSVRLGSDLRGVFLIDFTFIEPG